MRYAILDPTGNVTALVLSAVTPHMQPKLATHIQERHREVEQVGFVSKEVPEGLDCALRMAGGEFCGNATMSAAALFALTEDLCALHETLSLSLQVSGATSPVGVRLTRTGDVTFTGEVAMPRPLSVGRVRLAAAGTSAEVPLVRMTGISHAVIKDENPLFWLKGAPEAAEQACRTWCEELATDGLGLMFGEGAGTERQLTPLVYVPGAGTLFWESSCASGSAACGIWEAHETGSVATLALAQPGGTLEVRSNPSGSAWICGQVRRVDVFDEDL